MVFQKYVDDFLMFEKSEKMFEKKLNGDLYWHYIRYQVFMDLANQLSLIENYDYGHRNYIYEPTLKDAIIGSTFRNQSYISKKEVMIVPDHRLFDSKKKCREIYTNLICKNMECSYMVLYFGDSCGNMRQLDCKNIIYADVKKYLRKTKRETKPYPRISQEEFMNNISLMKNYLGIEVDANLAFKWMSCLYDYLSQREVYKSYYGFVLKKCKPLLVLLTESYEKKRFFLIEKAKELGIPVVELQHGYAGKDHLAYNYPEGIVAPIWFPDYFFSFGRIEKEETRFPIKKDSIIPVGFPELEAKIFGKKRRKRKTILFLSGPSIEVAELALQFERLCGSRYRIVFKLHPAELCNWRSIYGTRFSKSSIEVIDTMEKTIHDYLNEADWVVGISSTCLYEATMFDVKVAIFKRMDYERSYSLYHRGNALLIESASMLKKEIDSDEFNAASPEIYFERDAIKNINNGLRNIIEGTI